jgi:hypothetical protein
MTCELSVSSRDHSNHRFRAYNLSVAVRNIDARLSWKYGNGHNAVLPLRLYCTPSFNSFVLE